MGILGQVDLVLFRVQGAGVPRGSGVAMDSTFHPVNITIRGGVFFARLILVGPRVKHSTDKWIAIKGARGDGVIFPPFGLILAPFCRYDVVHRVVQVSHRGVKLVRF